MSEVRSSGDKAERREHKAQVDADHWQALGAEITPSEEAAFDAMRDGAPIPDRVEREIMADEPAPPPPRTTAFPMPQLPPEPGQQPQPAPDPSSDDPVVLRQRAEQAESTVRQVAVTLQQIEAERQRQIAIQNAVPDPSVDPVGAILGQQRVLAAAALHQEQQRQMAHFEAGLLACRAIRGGAPRLLPGF